MRKAWLAGAAALGAAACLDLSTNPTEIVGIDFDALPWPSIVAGDTLRDGAGAVHPLSATLYAGDGSEVTDGPVAFLVEAGAVRVGDGNVLVADDTATGTAKLRASTTSVQSILKQLEIVPRPDSMEQSGTISALEWVVPDNASTNTSVPLGVQLLSLADPDAAAPVRSWVVTFELLVNDQPVNPTDTTGVYLVGDAGKPSYADTTDAQGTVTRRVRVRIAPGFTPPDSVVLTMRAAWKGTALAGGPVTLVLPLKPR